MVIVITIYICMRILFFYRVVYIIYNMVYLIIDTIIVYGIIECVTQFQKDGFIEGKNLSQAEKQTA